MVTVKNGEKLREVENNGDEGHVEDAVVSWGWQSVWLYDFSLAAPGTKKSVTDGSSILQDKII